MPKQQDSEQTAQRTAPYVYYSYEQWGRGYLGSRTAKGCHPGDDYLGSYTDKTFEPTDKIILFEGDRLDCLEVEIKLHNFFDVARNPHFANKARATNTAFIYENYHPTPEQRAKTSQARMGTQHSDETKARISESGKARHVRATHEDYAPYRQSKRAHYRREVWEAVEKALASANGSFHWGRGALSREYGVNEQTIKSMMRLMKAGVTFDEAISGEK